MNFEDFLGVDTAKGQTESAPAENAPQKSEPMEKSEEDKDKNKNKNKDKKGFGLPDDFFDVINTEKQKREEEESRLSKLESERRARIKDAKKLDDIETEKKKKKEEMLRQMTEEETKDGVAKKQEDEDKKKLEAKDKEIEEKKRKEEEEKKRKEEEERKKKEEEEEAERKRKEEEEEKKKKEEEEYTINKNFIDISTIKDIVIEGVTKKIEEINIAENIDIKEIRKPDEEYMTIYYILNDNADNPEFLDENVLAISRKEAELREMRQRKEEEFNFQMEELVDINKITVDLTGLLDDTKGTA
jgi:hypothetical protein